MRRLTLMCWFLLLLDRELMLEQWRLGVRITFPELVCLPRPSVCKTAASRFLVKPPLDSSRSRLILIGIHILLLLLQLVRRLIARVVVACHALFITSLLMKVLLVFEVIVLVAPNRGLHWGKILVAESRILGVLSCISVWRLRRILRRIRLNLLIILQLAFHSANLVLVSHHDIAGKDLNLVLLLLLLYQSRRDIPTSRLMR
jgi:hypothetical protein